MSPEEYTELDWLGFSPGRPLLPYVEHGAWGDLLDPNMIHDYVWEGDE